MPEPRAPRPTELVTNYFDKDIEDMGPLLSHLSTTFSAKPEDVQKLETDENLGRIVESDEETAMFTSSIEDRIVATATANLIWTPSPEGWVDDVVTHPDFENQGFGSAVMRRMHDWFRANNVQTVRLTSSHKRETAGDMYEKMGYVIDGKVWRAPLTEGNICPDYEELVDQRDYEQVKELLQPKPRGMTESVDAQIDFGLAALAKNSHVVAFPGGGSAEAVAVAAHCPIPTGIKAWLYGVNASNVTDMASIIRDAHGILVSNGAKSANTMTFADTSEEYIEALRQTGYEERATRLYTLHLN